MVTQEKSPKLKTTYWKLPFMPAYMNTKTADDA